MPGIGYQKFRYLMPDPCSIGSGGADRDRTGDLLLAKQALSQLSYGPGIRSQMSFNPACQPKPQAYLSPLPPRQASADNPPPLAQA